MNNKTPEIIFQVVYIKKNETLLEFLVSGRSSKQKNKIKEISTCFLETIPPILEQINWNQTRIHNSHIFYPQKKILIGHSGRFAIGSLKIKIKHTSSHIGEIRNQRAFCFNFFPYIFLLTIFFCHGHPYWILFIFCFVIAGWQKKRMKHFCIYKTSFEMVSIPGKFIFLCRSSFPFCNFFFLISFFFSSCVFQFIYMWKCMTQHESV